MTSDGQSVERLRDYLRALTPEARAMLVAEFERGMRRGEDVPGGDLVLEELRRTIRSDERPASCIGDAAELFFAPVEPFLIDDAVDHRRLGRLARVSLAPIWNWIGRDLIPEEAKALSGDVNRALAAGDRTKAEQSIRALHDVTVQRMTEVVAAAASGEKARRRLDFQVGTPRALEDLGTLLRILTIRDVLADLARRLPPHIRGFEREQIDHVKTVIESAAGTKSAARTDAARNTDIFLHGFILIMGRLAAPWQLIRIATRAAETDEAARILESPYALAVTIVLGEVESMVKELRAELKARRPITSLLKGIHDAARVLRTEMDLAVDSPWSRQLAAIRTEVSNLLRAEIESAPPRIRQLLRLRPAKEIVPGSLLDAIDVNDVEMQVECVGACHSYANELAVNEVTTRTYSELQHYLESGTKMLLDALRHAGDADRPFRQSQVEAAIRFCRTVFGKDYAGLLAKAAEIAVQTGTMERKPVRA